MASGLAQRGPPALSHSPLCNLLASRWRSGDRSAASAGPRGRHSPPRATAERNVAARIGDLGDGASAFKGCRSGSPSCKPWASADLVPEDAKMHTGSPAWVHFVGIGGAGLAPLAVLAKRQGWHVTGSDAAECSRVEDLLAQGIKVHVGHSKDHLYRQTGGPTTRPACLVVSSAIGSNNPEVQEAFRLGIPVVDRRQWMPAATEGADVVAVAGTHGKSTTSAMLGWALAGAGRGPYVSLVGAQVPQFSLPALGLHVEPGPEGRGADLAPGFAADARTAGDLASPAAGAVAAGEEIPDEGLRARMVVEADEYGLMFLGLRPLVAVVTELDWDHPDQFDSEEDVVEAFGAFAKTVRPGGLLLLNGDSRGCQRLREALAAHPGGRFRAMGNEGGSPGSPGCEAEGPLSLPAEDTVVVATFGRGAGCDFRLRTGGAPAGSDVARPLGPATGLPLDAAWVEFGDAGAVPLGPVRMPGAHNAMNACAALVAGCALNALTAGGPSGRDPRAMLSSAGVVAGRVGTFEGLARRTELLGQIQLGPSLRVEVYDDYAHHPTEIRACIAALNGAGGRGRVGGWCADGLMSLMGSSASTSASASGEWSDGEGAAWGGGAPSTLANGHGPINGHAFVNGHSANGHAHTNGHAYTNGHAVANGHAPVNGHSYGPGEVLPLRLPDVLDEGAPASAPSALGVAVGVGLAHGREFPPVQGEGRNGHGLQDETWAVIQPHTFSRVQAFQSGFVESVRGAARALVMDVYGAREEGNPVSTSQALVANMNDDCQVPMARYTGDVYSTVLDIKRQLLSLAQISSKERAPITVRVVFMGAGDVVQASRGLLSALHESNFEPLVPQHSQDGTDIRWA